MPPDSKFIVSHRKRLLICKAIKVITTMTDLTLETGKGFSTCSKPKKPLNLLKEKKLDVLGHCFVQQHLYYKISKDFFLI